MKQTFLTNSYAKAGAVFTTSLLFPANAALASSIGEAGLSGTVSSIQWPWTKFLNSLAEELTGPVPKVLGIMGIAGAAIAMFAGHGGPGTNRFITLIFAVSICLFAPTFISAIMSSGSGLTIFGF